ncbi:A-kinase anchor protein 1, mitochondrial-like [Acanthaster planci]|uniref:A-kinase anchor protein 1, mitochondrial-like n=1 Tax=Acanthaster planci TaxID=133434 RepID=A0A8B7YY97_ACAPL|nr:A-kinase anchor protein 1, mitochondrial-like [Acanthaster planci]XP_022096224.1 A-kinase anchor protein 1, mitochondrial-like [Acanthaster planci]XP_022096226.1 A-kinase anchor protein 1, mitochondrial-like [Acanthaster planci]
MAQLRYTKYVAVCGTALTAGLVGLYLYKRRAAKKEEERRAKGEQESKAEENMDSNESKPESQSERDTARDIDQQVTVPDDSGIDVEEVVMLREKSLDQEFPQTGDKQLAVVDEVQDMFEPLDTIESAPTESSCKEEVMLVEEPVMQSAQMPVESLLPPSSSTLESSPRGYSEAGSEGSLTLDWATAVDQVDEMHKEESLVSPTTSLQSHPEGSVAGSDLSTETNSDSSSLDSGRCTGSTTSTGTLQHPQPAVREMPTVYQFEFPAKECGRLIGKAGKNIKGIRSRSGAKVTLRDWPDEKTKQICVIEGFQSEIDAALADIQNKFPLVDTSKQYIEMEQVTVPAATVPEMSQIHLHEEIVNDVIVSSVVSAGHVFVQQPTHPTYMALTRLNTFMNNCYSQMDMTPPLPRPIEVGVICAAPMMQGWYRAQIVDIFPDTDEVDLKFLDFGGYARIESYVLKQIRTDFMSLPFQANECYLSNIAPLAGEEDFSEVARLFVEQVAQNFNILQAQVTGYCEDGMPFIELFYTDSERKVQSLNKELVNQGLVTWYEEGMEESLTDTSLLSEVEPTSQ